MNHDETIEVWKKTDKKHVDLRFTEFLHFHIQNTGQ